MSTAQVVAVDCTLTPYTGEPAACPGCAADLPRRRDGKPSRSRVWCTTSCRESWWAEHDWQKARRAVLRRDGWTCQHCGITDWQAALHRAVGYQPWIRVWSPPADATDWRAATGQIAPTDAEADRWGARGRHPDWPGLPESVRELIKTERANYQRHRRHDDARAQAKAKLRPVLEVNHIVPRRGGGYQPGCHHHHDNLETLCRPCHVAVTTAQRRARALGLDDTIVGPAALNPAAPPGQLRMEFDAA